MQWLFFEQNRIEPVIGTARYWLLTGRAASRREALAIKQAQAADALAVMERHLRDRSFLVSQRYTIADLALYAYTHLAPEAGVDLDPYPAARAWMDCVRAQPGQVADVAPYPPHARFTGSGRERRPLRARPRRSREVVNPVDVVGDGGQGLPGRRVGRIVDGGLGEVRGHRGDERNRSAAHLQGAGAE